jgi:WD40 repeat protein
MRQESMGSGSIVGQCPSSPATKRVGLVRVPLISRQAAGLLAVGFLVLGWLLEATPLRPAAPPRLVRGEPGVLIWSFVLSPDGKKMAVIDSTRTVTLRAVDHGWDIVRTLPRRDYPRVVAFSPDSRFLACGGSAPGITLYDLESDAAPRDLAVPVDQVRAVAFAPDGRTVAVAALGNADIFLWDLNAARLCRRLHAPAPVQSIAFAPEGRHLASGGRGLSPSIVLWDLDTGLGRAVCGETLGPINALAFSPDGQLLASACVWERCVRIWDVSSAKSSRVLAGHRFGTNSLAFSPDGSTLATAGNDGLVRLWDVADSREQAVLDGRGLGMGPVAFCGGNYLVATARDDSALRVWDVAALGPRAVPDHSSRPTSAARVPASREMPDTISGNPHSEIGTGGVYSCGESTR